MFEFKLFERIILTILLCVSTISNINGQTFAFNLQSSALTFDYTTNANFATIRTIPRAFTVSITNSRIGRYNIYCKIISNSNTYTDNAPFSLFGIKVNSANFTVGSSYYQTRNLGLTDVLVANVTGRRSLTDTIYFDLVLNPLDFTVLPSNYNYSFVFTVTEY